MRILDRHQDADAVLSYNARIGGDPADGHDGQRLGLSGEPRGDRANQAGRAIAREQPDLWELALPSFTKALARYQREGVIVSSGAIERGLTTVAIPITSGNSASVYPLYCSAISSALPADLIKRELVPMMKKLAQELRVVLPAM